MTQFFFVSGIDTDIGKTIATGFLAQKWLTEGLQVTTVKCIQTGASTIEESDLAKHRAMMQRDWDHWDRAGLTAPYLFPYPASPHLASALCQGRTFQNEKVQNCLQQLQGHFDRILLEGAGGLMVPLREDLLTIDWICQNQWPVILVTSGRLGSINHTLLSLEALRARNIPLFALVYNSFGATSPEIQVSTKTYLQNHIQKYYPHTLWIDLPEFTQSKQSDF